MIKFAFTAGALTEKGSGIREDVLFLTKVNSKNHHCIRRRISFNRRLFQAV